MFGFNVGSIVARLKLDTRDWAIGKKSVQNDLRTLSRDVALLGTAIMGMGTVAAREFGNYDRALREALAVSDVTAKQFSDMSDMAENASVSLNRAATETASAFYYLGSAGLSAADQMSAYNSTIGLARALTEDVSRASEGLVDIMKGFNTTFNRSQQVADTLVRTIVTSNQVFHDLDKAMAYVSGTAYKTNNTIAETAAAIGKMADAGIKGSMAGVAFRRALTNLMSPTGEMRDLIHELGLQVYTEEGRMRPFIDIFEDLATKVKGTSEQYQNMVFEVLFGRRAIAGMLRVFQLSRGELRAYANDLANAGGTMQKVIDKQMAAFLNQLGRVWQLVKKLSRSLGEQLAPIIETMADRLTPLIDQFDEWVTANGKLIRDFALLVVKVTAFSGALLGLTVAIPIIKSLARVIFKLATTTFALLFNKFTLAALAIYGISIAFRALYKTLKRFLEPIVNSIGEAFTKLWNAVGTAGTNTWQGIYDEFEEAIGVILGAFKDFVNRIIYGFELIGKLVHNLATTVPKLLKDIFTTNPTDPGYANWGEVIADLTKGLTDENVPDRVGDMMNKVVPVLKLGFEKSKEFVSDFSRHFVDTMKSDYEFVSDMFKTLYGKVMPDWMKRLFAPIDTFADMQAEFGLRLPKLGPAPYKGMVSMRPDAPNRFKEMWHEATVVVIDDFKKVDVAIQDMMKSTISNTETAFKNFLEISGSFSDKLMQLFDDLFAGIYDAFTDMVAKMMAQQLFGDIFGAGYDSKINPTPLTWSDVLRLIGTSNFTEPRFNYSAPSNFESSTGGFGNDYIGNFAPKVALNVTNESGVPIELDNVQSSSRGEEIVLNATMKLAQNNKSFRDTFVNR